MLTNHAAARHSDAPACGERPSPMPERTRRSIELTTAAAGSRLGGVVVFGVPALALGLLLVVILIPVGGGALF
jgi:hypothetical protein